ncbi:MAG: DUF3536 domain-containing protein [Spirochaetaceae bacterium]
MKNALILHGHFYQPPREHPWTGLIPYQDSAAPFHDWNRRINKECYAANTASRFLRYDGRIEDIINNYEILSFNFGPTLLGWLHRHAPHIHEAIVEADRRSVEYNNGHGNAIAQSYNHTILPLDAKEDARLQIRWGLRDFYSHFGREAEGMWLPETAVDGSVLDILIEEGLKYVILSPWQAKSIKADGSREKTLLEGKPAPSWRPYRIERKRGSIAAFFYNHELASGISFEHYLRSADSLYTRLLGYHNDADPGHLVHTATDGEVYGHHEPFGDMCLAALRRHVENGDKFVFTNYGAYLEKNSPAYTAVLAEGEGKRGTSWSCFHGVSRWYKNCGCSTGGKEGWNQKWRTPLRTGVTAVSGELREIYRSRCAALSSVDPEYILDRYIEVKAGLVRREDFAKEILDKDTISAEKREELFTLLEGNVYRMYMFTSCGWFFADISGLEPVQNILYALKAIALYEPFTNKDLYSLLRSHLEEAKSNIPSYGSGADIMDTVSGELPDGVEAATYFFVIYLVSKEVPEECGYGFFSLLSIKKERRTDRHTDAVITLTDTTREKKFSFRFSAEQDNSQTLTIQVEDLLEREAPFSLDLSKLPVDLRSKIRSFLVNSTEKSFADIASSLFEEAGNAIIRTSELKMKPSSIITKTAEISLHSLIFAALPDRHTPLTGKTAEELEKLFDFAATYGIELETEQIAAEISEYLWWYSEKMKKGSCGPDCDILIRILGALRRGGIEPDLTIPQKHVFSHARSWRKKLEETESLGKDEREELYRVIGICNAMGIYADDLMHRVSVLGTP